MCAHILTTMGLGLSLAGCQAFNGKDAPRAAQSASSICTGYGLKVDTTT